MQPTILKIGGSLLMQSDWALRLQRWLAKQSAGYYLAIVGGGAIVDGLRELDSVHNLNQATLHWKCIELLDATFEVSTQILYKHFRNLAVLSSPIELESFLLEIRNRACEQPELVLVRVSSFYCQSLKAPAAAGMIAPEIGWQTTSDTLAMYLAQITQSPRCVLFKSCDVDQYESLNQAAEAGVMDHQVIKFSRKDIDCELVRL